MWTPKYRAGVTQQQVNDLRKKLGDMQETLFSQKRYEMVLSRREHDHTYRPTQKIDMAATKVAITDPTTVTTTATATTTSTSS